MRELFVPNFTLSRAGPGEQAKCRCQLAKFTIQVPEVKPGFPFQPMSVMPFGLTLPVRKKMRAK